MLSLCLATSVIFNGEISLPCNYTVIRYTRDVLPTVYHAKCKLL
jgi:hypothetical protein